MMHRGRRRIYSLFTLALLGICLTGCEESLDTSYGTYWEKSVNGTNVFMEMFRQEGFEAFGRTNWSPSVAERTDVVIWTPDALPNEESRTYWQEWLQEKPGRVVVFVGPDFDAAPQYWQSTLVNVPLDDQARFRDELEEALYSENRRQGQWPSDEDFDWFVYRKFLQKPPQIAGKPFSGDPNWRQDIKPDEANLTVNSMLDPGFDFDILLMVENVPFIFSRNFLTERGDQSKLYVVANGSFLFNLPLVNSEHRKLAHKFIAEVKSQLPTNEQNQDEPVVCFLTSDTASLNPLEIESPESGQEFPPKMLWLVLLQIALLGVIFSFSCWPVLGKKRIIQPEQQTDFGRHIQAVGELLADGRHYNYAQQKLAEYEQAARDETRGLQRRKK